MGAAAVARLHADPAFRAELEAAKAELAAVRAKGLKPTRDCQAEADVLARAGLWDCDSTAHWNPCSIRPGGREKLSWSNRMRNSE